LIDKLLACLQKNCESALSVFAGAFAFIGLAGQDTFLQRRRRGLQKKKADRDPNKNNPPNDQ